MKKIKITKEQYDRLISESLDVKGGVNRVNTSFKKQFNGLDVQNLGEDEFNITKPISGLPKTKMTKTKEVPAPESINEDIFSPEVHKAVHDFIQNIWLNPSQKGLDKFFIENGITWGDIISFLTSVGVVAAVGGGLYKVTNFFKRKFTGDKQKDIQLKMDDIEKMTRMVEKDPESPWQKKLRLQGNNDSGYEATPKSVNLAGRNAIPSDPHPSIIKKNMEEISNYPTGSDNDPSAPWNQDSSDVQVSTADKIFKPIVMNYEIALLNGPDGMYVFYYDDIDRSNLPNAKYDLTIEDLADYVNENLGTIKRGDGMEGWNSGAELIKLDEPLKEELLKLYSKDKNLTSALQRLEEMTSAASSGAFTGPFGGTPSEKKVKPEYTPSEQISEMTSANGGSGEVGSTTTGQYVQPAIWANGKKNWKAAKKTQYPGGEMVDLDSCTKLNNNKAAQNGKCSTGAADGVVKTHKTKQSVISKSIYEEVAKRTGKTIEEVEKIINSKLNKDKSLS
jgi:hypothetical protein